MAADAPHSPTPTLIPITPGFPVTWATPDEEGLSWMQDRMHAPDPLAPLDGEVWVLAYRGFDVATAAYEMPIRAHARRVNTYLYFAIAPTASPDQMEALGKRGEERLNEAMGRLESSWRDEWLPEVQSNLAWWATFDLPGASTSSLTEHLRETATRLERIWQIHFLIVLPAYTAMSEFDELYRDLFGKEDQFGAYRLLEGKDNKTLEGARALWALSRKAQALPEVSAVLQQHQPAAIMDALGDTSTGRAFRDEFRGFLQVYGQRGDTWGLIHRSWIEDPAPALKNLKDYASQPELDLEADHAALDAGRDRAVADTEERLKGYPAAVRERFAFLLEAAQVGSLLSEDHGFWIDFACLYRVRCVFMELGRRLEEAGALANADDVFYLTLEEALDTDGTLRQAALRRSQVAERKADVERFRPIDAPPVLGTDYGPPPDDMVGRFITKFFGGPPPASDDPDVLKGNAGSPGNVRGTARVTLSLEDAGRLKQGDILVTSSTAPPLDPALCDGGRNRHRYRRYPVPLRGRRARVSHSSRCGHRRGHRDDSGWSADRGGRRRGDSPSRWELSLQANAA